MTSNSAEQRDEIKQNKSALIGLSTNSEKKVTFEAEDEQTEDFEMTKFKFWRAG